MLKNIVFLIILLVGWGGQRDRLVHGCSRWVLCVLAVIVIFPQLKRSNVIERRGRESLFFIDSLSDSFRKVGLIVQNVHIH